MKRFSVICRRKRTPAAKTGSFIRLCLTDPGFDGRFHFRWAKLWPGTDFSFAI